MPPQDDQLLGASNALLSRIDRLRELEQLKRSLPLDDPRVPDLSAEIERLAARARDAATDQRERAEELGGTT